MLRVWEAFKRWDEQRYTKHHLALSIGSGLNITQRYGNNRYITRQQLWIYKEYQAKPRSFLQRDISHYAANEITARL